MTHHASSALIDEWKAEERRPFAGWDFSYLNDKWTDEKPPWSYEDLVRAVLRGSSSVLDVGTGGGERLLSLRAALPATVVATEGYPPNLALARQRLAPLGAQVLAAESSLRGRLPVPDAAFDVVLNRHSGLNISEVGRVLRPGGTLLTQQVDGTSLQDLMAAFDSKPKWPWSTLDFYLDLLGSAGLGADLAEEWTGRLIFKSVGALVYYLRAVPWLVDGFSVATHLPYIEQQQARLEQDGQLVFSQKLFVLRAKKAPTP